MSHNQPQTRWITRSGAFHVPHGNETRITQKPRPKRSAGRGGSLTRSLGPEIFLPVLSA